MNRSGVLKYASSNSFGIIADLISKLIYLNQAILKIVIRMLPNVIPLRTFLLFRLISLILCSLFHHFEPYIYYHKYT